MAKTMAIFKAVALALVLVPLANGLSVEEELAHLKEIVSALQAQVAGKVDSIDFKAQMETTIDEVKAQMDVNVVNFAARITGVEERLDTVDSVANILDFKAQMKKKVDVDDFIVKLNDTEELEARVTVLEESMSDLEVGFVMLTDEVDDVESVNILQDDRINTLEAEIFDNENDIEELVDITSELTTQVTSLEQDVAGLDQRVENLESGGGGGSGNITDYSDSIFMAVLTTYQTTDQDPLVFDWDVINPGGHYSNVTGKYTVPYDGIYSFSAHLQAWTDTYGVYFYLEIDDSSLYSHYDTWYDEAYRATTILLELTAGQTVHVTMHDGVRGHTAYFYTYFSGYLISPSN